MSQRRESTLALLILATFVVVAEGQYLIHGVSSCAPLFLPLRPEGCVCDDDIPQTIPWCEEYCMDAAPGTLRRPHLLRGEGIVGGTNANISDFPYQLSFQRRNRHTCGASIISEDWAITAGHCCYEVSAAEVTLRAGSSVASKGGEVHQVADIIIHEQYENYGFGSDNDIAVLKENEPASQPYAATLDGDGEVHRWIRDRSHGILSSPRWALGRPMSLQKNK